MATATKKKVSKKKTSANKATATRPRVLKRPLKKKAAKAKPDGLTLVGAAVEVLRGLPRNKSMTTGEIMEAIEAAKLWKPARAGKTPAATLSTCILRDMRSEKPRFAKVARGQFCLKKGA
jgi:hypothetical protein